MDKPCSHSLSRRLSKKLALLTMAVLGLLSIMSWNSVEMLISQRSEEDLRLRSELVSNILALEARNGGEAAVLSRLHSDAPMRGHTRLEVWHVNGQPLYADATNAALQHSSHLRSHDFVVKTEAIAGGELHARWTMDYTRDMLLGRRWALALVLITLATGGLVALGTGYHVRRQLRPLRSLAVQTRGISPQNLHHRLSLADPAEELSPLVDQFNALMGRLEQSYAQLEGFNADVAHELRTPLANLIGQTEVALSRERSVDSLRDTLVSNLEEMQRLTAMVNDMLFLSHADRGAVARRGQPVSLATLAQQVVEFHEAPLEEAGLQLRVEGDALLPVDESLFKRAVSNLLGNATRFARRGSTVIIGIEAAASDMTDAVGQVRVVVQNEGEAIDAVALPRLFDRFFRCDTSRACEEGDGQHYGLGLAIVAAIARMHAGRTVAESSAGITRVGFTLATG